MTAKALSSFDIPEKSFHVGLFRSEFRTTLVYAFIDSFNKHALSTSFGASEWPGAGKAGRRGG